MAERGGTPAPQSRMDTHGVRAAHSSLWLMPPSGDRGGRAATPGEARVQRDLHGRTAHSGQANATQEVPPTSHQGQSHHRPSHLSPILPPSPLLFFLLTKLLLFFEDRSNNFERIPKLYSIVSKPVSPPYCTVVESIIAPRTFLLSLFTPFALWLCSFSHQRGRVYFPNL